MLQNLFKFTGDYPWMGKVSITDALLYSVLGMAVVFFGLIALMCVIKIMHVVADAGKKKEAKPEAAAPAAAPVAAAPAAATPVATGLAKGTAGEIKLYDTPERDAAKIMAIVADHTGIPLNELRFISIKEVK